MNTPFFGIQLLWIALAVIAIAALGGFATSPNSDWYRALDKPSWQPPASWFGPVWSSLYILLIVSANLAFIHTTGEERSATMWIYAINGVFNLAWSFIFFRGQSPVLGGIDIIAVWVTIILMMLRAWPASPLAAVLLVPYFLWVSFASVLNWAIAIRNR